MQQNYYLDIGYIYYGVSYHAYQSLVDENVTNESYLVVLSTYLPILNSQVLSYLDTCELPPQIKPRNVEITLQDNTKYKFDIPFNSSNSVNWSALLNQLDVTAIKDWVITGEKIPGYKLPLLLTKVP